MTVVFVPSFPPAGLAARLADCGLFARLLLDEAVTTDHRLHVTAPGRPVQVELLGPLSGLVDAPVWHAVRDAHGDRAVWCGPLRTCDDAVLCRFLRELIELPVEELRARWQRLG